MADRPVVLTDRAGLPTTCGAASADRGAVLSICDAFRSNCDAFPTDCDTLPANCDAVPILRRLPGAPSPSPVTLSTVRALRYVAPLREGGSLPAVVETDGGRFAVKFRGAGQGARALVAEIVVGGLAQALDLPLPALAVVTLDEGFGRAEPDPEIQDILRGSQGVNVGLGFLDGAFPYDPVAAADLVAPELASAIVWLDALATNIDRTARNPNLLVVPGTDGPALWLIDHGAALYFHHDWPGVDEARAQSSFPAIRDHVLLPLASETARLDADLAARLTPDVLAAVVGAVPDALLMDAPEGRTAPFATPEANRDAYLAYLTRRLAGGRAWVTEAVRAREARLAAPDAALGYRR